MNRKILFRGFHPGEKGKTVITLNGEKIHGEWVYGGYDYHKATGRGFIVVMGVDNKGPIAYIQEVLPETVGQWVTTDKNKKDVFEGDIGRINGYATDYTVVYDEAKYMFGLWCADIMEFVELGCNKISSVIGNKWEVQE